MHSPATLALRSTRLMGLMSVGFGLVMLVVYGYFNRLPQFRFAFKALSLIVWVLPGIAFLTASIFMARGQRWGTRTALIAALIQCVCAVAFFVANFLLTPISIIPIVLSFAWAAALIQMIVHLRRSLQAAPVENFRAFEVLPPKNVDC